MPRVRPSSSNLAHTEQANVCLLPNASALTVVGKYAKTVPIAVIIEPDSLPNLATNTGNPHCGNSATESVMPDAQTLATAAVSPASCFHRCVPAAAGLASGILIMRRPSSRPFLLISRYRVPIVTSAGVQDGYCVRCHGPCERRRGTWVSDAIRTPPRPASHEACDDGIEAPEQLGVIGEGCDGARYGA